MQAVLTERRFSDENWIFERKLDGIRCLASRRGGEVRLRSRTDHDLSGRFPEIAQALRDEGSTELMIDGEVVAFDGEQTSFARLQQRRARPTPVFYYAFDILRADGEDLTRLPLRERKQRLRDALTFRDPLRFTAHRNRDGEAFFAEACQKGWEGLIAKRADSPYTHGRSSDWLKFKCSFEQEFVVGGFTAPRGSRTHLGALLLGYHESGRLRYAGKVGTGFTHETLSELASQLAPLERETSPFADEVRERTARWVTPRLVAQVGFSEWTRDGRLRHPRYLGLREDKPAAEVVRE